MARSHWTLDDIPWDRFDRDRVDPDQEKLARAAAMVEYNSPDYVAYLEHVFADDPAFLALARQWGEEERQHGEALARWASLADPTFDFERRFRTFTDGYRIDTEVDHSVRGSRAGELVARCMIEVGTSSYYTAMGDACQEPALKAICRRIAADELRHYKMFYDALKRYLKQDRLNRLQRIRVAITRASETEDDELSYAYYAANNEGEAYNREAANRAYMRRAMRYYRDGHIERALAMIFKACGLKPHSPMFRVANRGATWFIHRRQRRLERLAA